MIHKKRPKKTKAEIEELRKQDAKQYTEKQLSVRDFCVDCLKHKTHKRFPASPDRKSGRKPYCFLCEKKRKKVRELNRRLLDAEIYTENAVQPVIDKVVAGRQLVTTKSLAKFLDVNERTILRMGRRGEITPYNFLGQIYFKKEEIEKYIEENLGEKLEIGSEYIS